MNPSLSKNQHRLSFLTEYASNLWETLQRWTIQPWFAYVTIFLLQLKRVWGAWQSRDLTFGDTSSYFMFAYGWAKEFSVNILWSPLYTAYYGTVFKLVPDVYWATLLHRLLIVFALAIMVLALMRRLLPEGIAWLVAAWWVVLPINFDSLYEVHLFAVLLPLTAILLVLYRPGVWSRGAVIGILIADMVLVRNEIIIALCLWVLVCFLWEMRQVRLGHGKELKGYLLAYGLPIVITFLSIWFFNWRTLIKPAPEQVSAKHTRNVCQIYAFGYQQRHPSWTESPWRDCQDLMLQVFGESQPSMIETIKANPRAMLGHFLWNIRLLPAGLQVALFNAASDHVNPDYVPVPLDKSIVLLPSVLALGLSGIGLVQLYRNRQFWWSSWLENRAWGWALLICLSMVMTVVIPMQRPRPSYMFLLTLFLMASLGMCLVVVAHRLQIYRLLPRTIFAGMISLILLVPSYYSTGDRPLLNLYRKLAPSARFIGIPGTALVMSSQGYAQQLCQYFTKSSRGACIGEAYDVLGDITHVSSVGRDLNQQPVPVVALVVDENFYSLYGNNPSVQAFLDKPEQQGWKLVSVQDNFTGRWRVYVNVLRLNVIAPQLTIKLSER